ncbi:MAG: YraN family protein [Gammaproteobacteria bacterium]|nr:YraN family protein [Gammaproteobacteria bacterium]
MVAGRTAESAACDYLCQQGLKLLERNYHGRQGEIDLIMEDAGTLVFVEVKYRSRSEFGDAAAFVTVSKQQRLIATANRYLQRYRQPPRCRFDVIAMNGQTGIDWIRNAFDSH